MGQFTREIRKDQRTEVQWMGHKTTVPVRIRNKLRDGKMGKQERTMDTAFSNGEYRNKIETT
jgi:hypothetical protein